MSERKPEGLRSGHRPIVYNEMKLEWDGETRGPGLQDIADQYGIKIKFHPITVAWWENWRNSAQAMVMHDTDWFAFLECAMLHHKMYSSYMKVSKDGTWMEVWPSPSEMTTLAGEIRRRTEQYGATYADRKKFNYKIKVDQRQDEASIRDDAERTISYFDKLNAEYAKKRGE